MATISKSGINPNQLIKSEHLTRIIDAFNGISNIEIIISGSLKTTSSNVVDFVSAEYVTGSFKGDGSQLTGIPTGSGGGGTGSITNINNFINYEFYDIGGDSLIGSQNSINTYFTASQGGYDQGKVIAYINGVGYWSGSGLEETDPTNGYIKFETPPDSTDNILLVYSSGSFTSQSIDNNYVNNIEFDNNVGQLILTREGIPSLSSSLDGRYVISGSSIGNLNNDLNYVSSGSNISQFNNDAGFITNAGSNNYVDDINVSGTTVKTITLNRNGLSSISASFQDESGVAQNGGTWTPIIGGSLSGTYSYLSLDCNYKKVGGIVFISGNISNISGNGSGFFEISNFPYTVDTADVAMTIHKYADFSDEDQIIGTLISSGDKLRFTYKSSVDNDMDVYLQDLNLSNATLFFSGWYFTNE